MKKKILAWLKLYDADEVWKIVDYWTLQHKVASLEIDKLKNDIEKIRKENLSLIAYDPNKVISVSAGKLKLGEYEMTEQEAKGLREEAAFLKKTELWKIMQNTLTEEARLFMFENAKDFCAMHAGKATLHDLRAMRNILENIFNYAPTNKNN